MQKIQKAHKSLGLKISGLMAAMSIFFTQTFFAAKKDVENPWTGETSGDVEKGFNDVNDTLMMIYGFVATIGIIIIAIIIVTAWIKYAQAKSENHADDAKKILGRAFLSVGGIAATIIIIGIIFAIGAGLGK